MMEWRSCRVHGHDGWCTRTGGSTNRAEVSPLGVATPLDAHVECVLRPGIRKLLGGSWSGRVEWLTCWGRPDASKQGDPDQCGDAFPEFVEVNLPNWPNTRQSGTERRSATPTPQVLEGDSTTAAPSQFLRCPAAPGYSSTRSHHEQQRMALTNQVAPPD